MAAYYIDAGTYDCSTSSTAITTVDTWLSWNSTTMTASTSAITVWYIWSTTDITMSSTTLSYVRDGAWTHWIDTAEVSAEARAAAARQREEIQQRAVAAAEAARAARMRARDLLVSLLHESQRAQLEQHRYFDVIAGRSRRRYRIHEGTHGNVRLLDDTGREVTRYCGQPTGVPVEDVLIAQKLQLEHDEESFLRAANASHM